MNKGIEFIKTFVKSDKQERLLYELQNPKKRENIFWRFAGSDIFKEGCLQKTDYMTADDLEAKLYQLNKSREVFYIGLSSVGEISLKKAVEKASLGEICVIYCGNGKGYYQGEQEVAKAPRYILSQKL